MAGSLLPGGHSLRHILQATLPKLISTSAAVGLHTHNPGLSAMLIQQANQDINQAFGLPADEGHVPATAAYSSQAPSATSAASAAEHTHAPRLTHIAADGQANMVDVSQKASTARTASASCVVRLGSTAFSLVQHHQVAKGNVLGTAQLAGIMAAKQAANLIPLCHNIPLSKVDVQLSLQPQDHSVHITASARTVGQTGVEMEALTAASVAALTVYDMCKAASKDIEITALRLDAKAGGLSGDYRRPA